MKDLLKVTMLIIIVSLFCTGCRGLADDAQRALKNVKVKPPKHMSLPKDCPYCDEGYVWYNGRQYECSYCKGNGYIFERVY